MDQPDVDADDADRFYGQVKALVEDRARRGWPDDLPTGLAVFVRARYPRRAAAALNSAKPSADMLGTNEALIGRVFVLDRNASQGWSAPVPSSDAGEVLDWAASAFDGCQIVVLYKDTLLLVDRAQGADREVTRQEDIRTTLPATSKAGLFDALNDFQLEVLTPRLCPGVWRPGHASKYHPAPLPEAAIQAKLKTFLNGWFRGLLRAEVEDSIETGRIDIRLLGPGGPGMGLAYWGIVELKVVKSYRSSKKSSSKPVAVRPIENARVIAEGITQANAFRVNRGCPCAVVEVFDMRKDKKTDPRSHSEVLRAEARCSPSPDVRLTPIFGSARDARNAGYT